VIFSCLLFSSAIEFNKDDIKIVAAKLLEDKVYPSIKTIDDALLFTEALFHAFENYTAPEVPLAPFPCAPTSRSNPPPTNARRLKPGDIDLVIGMGDSLTAGFGADATNFFNLFTDYRASSFSIGHSTRMTTLPTSFLVYNPNLDGYSVGNGNADSANSRLNVAVSGARSYDLQPQVENLLYKLENFDRGLWKHVALFIGGNDLCDSCTDWDYYSAANFQNNVQTALEAIRQNLPNVFVCLIGPPDITLLSELTGGWCGILRPFECSCTTDEGTTDLHPEYFTALHAIENHYNNANYPNFHVSVQPFFELIDIPRHEDGSADMTYFAPDCFHFSAKAHTEAALGLWNNLMETAANKKRYWFIGEQYECPSEDQFLQ